MAIILGLVSQLEIERLPAATMPAPRPTPAAVASPRVCVTRVTLCVVGPARAGSPCSCPHPLRGYVPGRVEMISGSPLTGAGASTRGSPRGEP